MEVETQDCTERHSVSALLSFKAAQWCQVNVSTLYVVVGPRRMETRDWPLASSYSIGLNMVGHGCTPSTFETEAGILGV